MSTTARSRVASAVSEKDAGRAQAADVFVVFGITGDLAKVMTFRSLYRLEGRGLLDCPIVGVAVDDWTSTTCASTRASRSRRGRTDRRGGVRALRARLSYVSGDFADATPTSGSRRRSGERGARSSTWRSRPRSSGW